MHTVGVSEVRRSLAGFLRQIRYDGQQIVIERRGKPLAALISIEDLALINRCRDDSRSIVDTSEGEIDHSIEEVDAFQDCANAAQEPNCSWGELEERVKKRTAELHEMNEALRREIANRKLVEQELRASEAQLKAFISHSPVEIGIKDAQGRYVLVNRIMEELSGEPPEGLIGKTPHQILEKAVADQVAHQDREVMRTGVPVECEIDGYWNGRYRVIQSNKFPISDELGCVVGVGAIAMDVTKQRCAQNALKESEERFRDIAANVPGVVYQFTVDVNGNKYYPYVGPTIEPIFGIKAEELMADGGLLYSAVHADDRARFDAATEESIRTLNPWHWEGRMYRRAGDLGWFQGSSTPRRLEDGSVLWNGILVDVTASKQAEEAIRTRDIWLRAILENSPIQIALKDTEGRLMAVSSNTVDYNGLRADQCVGNVTEELLPDAIAGIYVAADRKVVETGLPIQQEIAEEWTGSTKHYLSSKFPLKDDEGRILGVCSLTSDVTEVKQAEERLRQAQKMEAVGQLTGGVAHDFNNLLGIIQGNIELLVEKTEGENSRMQAILRASARGAELTQRLLAFSRRQSLRPQTIDLAALVQNMTGLLRRTLGATIEIETPVEPGLWNAMADPGQVENAILNLAINARDAMQSGGKLTIACFNACVDETHCQDNPEVLEGDYVVLTAIDNGAGMSIEVVEHAFEPFFTTKRVGEGSGLGLSMAYGFAKQSGGHVSIQSEEGRGTTVKLYLPRAGQAPGSAKGQVSSELPRGQGEQLLVIEDDSDLRELAVSMLDGLGYEVIGVSDAASARAVLGRGEPVDLVLSDIVLPGDQNGLEFAEEARGRFPDVRFVFMSGFPTDAAERDEFIGADRVLLHKPFRRQQLAKALRAELDRSA